MNAATILHYFFITTAAVATVALVFARSVFYGALYLMIILLSLAGLYVLSFAEFLAVTQILVYAGGVLVLIIFAIMLTSNLNGKPLLVDHSNRLSGGLLGLTLLSILVYLIAGQINWNNAYGSEAFALPVFGRLLMTRYVLPFELIGIVLLIALIGAAVVASSSTKRPKP
ncbi:NADH-quinone oxidoreductase subunit J [Chryseolinea sp. T2]|uniref:NADH-quinone oxidoreductase subunit J family protein n=1 Tax=Chryseolinea sp. T2 TaxID=3129255 RepID=UPI003076D9F3